MANFAKCLMVVCVLVWAFMPRAMASDPPDTCARIGFVVVEPHATPATRTLRTDRLRSIFVRRNPLTTTQDISDLKLVHPRDGDADDVTILIRFAPEAEQRLLQATTNHAGIRLAFLFDDVVLLNVEWQGPYGMQPGGSQLSIKHGLERARLLVNAWLGCKAYSSENRPPPAR